MSNSYSLAEARSHLARLVEEVEQGTAVELTRRGKPVAMVVPIADYRRSEPPRGACGTSSKTSAGGMTSQAWISTQPRSSRSRAR
ncbi:MAG: type II toxin-antitoxin system Phd/YefM family antitoxin [Thermoanaerobaculia bacterium]|nr:type II toxin-antitoxin system Phd/YefM family antitoxin [Thermoanaerobaculia bacterium]